VLIILSVNKFNETLLKHFGKQVRVGADVLVANCTQGNFRGERSRWCKLLFMIRIMQEYKGLRGIV